LVPLPFLPAVAGALAELTHKHNWEQSGAVTQAQASEAMAMMLFNWIEADMGCCPMRVNPFNGRLQQSDDDGITFFDVPDGPWTESLYPEFSGTPMPRPETTEAERLCAASATAAYVLANLYKQTGNHLLNYVAATDWEYAGALGAMLQGFLMMIGMVAAQVYLALATMLSIVSIRQQYVDNPLTAADEERLKCILLENATEDANGSVTFDFQPVWDAIDLATPKNDGVRFLLTMIGPDALNYSGGIDADVIGDCANCFSWCYDVNLGTTNGSFSIISGPGSWVSGVGWAAAYQSASSQETIYLERVFSARYIETIDIQFDKSAGGGANNVNNMSWRNAGVLVGSNNANPIGTNQIKTLTINATIDRLVFDLNSGTSPSTITIENVTYKGPGTTNPFGSSNC
jgi:hypothetical protein